MDDQLFNSICTRETLYSAWLRVKEKNTSGGIDFKTVNDYAVTVDQNLEELTRQLQSGNYIQHPYREVMIPKNETEKRRLGLLTVNDKIVQTAVTMVVTPILEQGFLKVSYAYREKKGAVKAINQVRHLITNERYTWLAACDIDNFFDTIPHDALFGKLSAYLKSPSTTELIRMFVKMGRVDRHYHWKDSRKGIPQGGVVSPLLANFYLYPLDKIMVEHGYGFVRYADDFVILGHTEEEAQKAMKEAMEVITHQLGLALNEEAAVSPVSKGFEFLGIYFNNGQIDLSEKKYHRLVQKMSEAAGLGQGLITPKLRETIQGIANFYAKLVPQEKLEKLDDELMAMLRLRSETLNSGKIKKGAVLEQLRTLQFFSQINNIHKTEYLNRQIGPSQHSHEKRDKSRKQKTKTLKSREAVLSRKHEYQKLEASGFDLAITQPGLVLGKRDKNATVRKNGQVVNEIPLINLKTITVLSDGVSLSSNLVEACAANKIAIDFLGKDGMPYAMIVSPSFGDAQTGIAQLEAYRNEKGFILIRHFVFGKINNQANLLRYYGKYYLKHNEKFREAFPKFIEDMEKYADSSVDLQHENLDEFRLKMFAVEGLASSCYWEMVEILIKAKSGFQGRDRQGATDLVNCMLNYGYGILYARVTEAIIRARLNPCLSYLHKPEGDRPSLVFDLIEEFRQQAVDRVVIALVMKNKNLKSVNGLLDDKTRKLVALKVIDRINSVEVFRKREMRFYEIIQHQAFALVKYLEGTAKKYKPYMPKW
ncbi:MAG: CRISPR-associated endonuclease Cas1 [Bacteroidetes bacterium]|nr:CRISPR-associated endonuclease Cas1 [Bacteroidota bacterium]